MKLFEQQTYDLIVRRLDDLMGELTSRAGMSEAEAEDVLKSFVAYHYFQVWRAVRTPSDVNLRSSEDWLKDAEFEGIVILDPDGWNRLNFKTSWEELISREEFRSRMMVSTCAFPGRLLQSSKDEKQS